MMTSEKNNVLDAPLIAKAINSFEKNDIQILLDVLVGKGFASSSIAQGLSHVQHPHPPQPWSRSFSSPQAVFLLPTLESLRELSSSYKTSVS